MGAYLGTYYGVIMKVPFGGQNKGKYPHPDVASNYGLREDMFEIKEYDDAPVKHKYFLLNTHNQFSKKLKDPQDASLVEIQPIDVEALIAEFKKEYKPYIDVFEKEYGPITYHYGFLIHYH